MGAKFDGVTEQLSDSLSKLLAVGNPEPAGAPVPGAPPPVGHEEL